MGRVKNLEFDSQKRELLVEIFSRFLSQTVPVGKGKLIFFLGDGNSVAIGLEVCYPSGYDFCR